MKAVPNSSTKSFNDPSFEDSGRYGAICLASKLQLDLVPDLTAGRLQEESESLGTNRFPLNSDFSTLSDNDNLIFEPLDFQNTRRIKNNLEDYMVIPGRALDTLLYQAASLCTVAIISELEGNTIYKKENIFLKHSGLSVATDSFMPEFEDRDKVEELIEMCERVYLFINENKIKSYLKNNNNVTFTLIECYKQLAKYFKQNIVNIFLEYANFEEEFESLYVTIKTDLSKEKYLKCFNKFEEKWLLNNNTEEKKRLFVKVRPV